MGISFGDILGAGIVGAAGGAGQAIYTDAEQQQQQAMLALRDQRLSQLRISEHAANVATDTAALPAQLQARSDAAVAQEQALAPVKAQEEQTSQDIITKAQSQRPYTMAPGSTRVTPGTVPATDGYDDAGNAYDASGNVINAESAGPTQYYTAPTRLTPEQIDYYQSGADFRKAEADRAKAQADALRHGGRTGGNWNQFDNQVQRLATQHLTTTDSATGRNVVDHDSLVSLTSLAQQYGRQDPTLSPGEAVDKAAQYVDEQRNIKSAANNQAIAEAGGLQFDNPNAKNAWIQSRTNGLIKSRSGSPPGIVNGAMNQGSSPAPTSMRLPMVGAVVNGYKFKGGDPSNKANWESVQ